MDAVIAAISFYDNSLSCETEIVAGHFGVCLVEVIVANCTPLVLPQHFESSGRMGGLVRRSCYFLAGISVY